MTNEKTEKQVTKEVKMAIDPKGKVDRADAISELVQERKKIETDLAAYSSGKRKRLREIKKEEERLSDEIDKGEGLVPVACNERMVYSANIVELVSVETGEVIDRRPMTQEERQTALPVPASGTAGEGGKRTRVKKPESGGEGGAAPPALN